MKPLAARANSIRRLAPPHWAAAAAALAAAVWAGPAGATKITLKDGRVLEGKVALLESMIEDLKAKKSQEGVDIRPILFVDDDLRRTFVAKGNVVEVVEPQVEPVETFHISQPVAREGARLASVGQTLAVTPWDDFGRRTLRMNMPGGTMDVIQAITMVTPQWCKVETIPIQGKPVVKWDMRLATSAIPRDVLGRILARQIDSKQIDQRLKLVRLYLQGDRYKDAEAELNQVIADFPESKDLYQGSALRLRQAFARTILEEIRRRRDSGQHALASAMLAHFPAENVAGETLQAVSKMLEDYQADFARVAETLKHFDEDLARLNDSAHRAALGEIRDELHRELNLNTLPRMAAYRQFWDDAALGPEDRVALAVSGWLVGTADATRKLPVAASLVEVRRRVLRYLRETVKLNRERVLAEIRGLEGGTPPLVARLVAHMRPPLEPAPPPAPEAKGAADAPAERQAGPGEPAGEFQFEVDVLPGDPTATYYVQLPPEYDPHRLYPTVVTLHAGHTTPQQQLDWWCGPRAAGGARQGQAGRYGYIVIAPGWAKTGQRTYNYSAEEHFAVLNALRDACRRFAVDTDRVYLSGHSMGGDAAWDIGIAHPDLWAGLVPISAAADKYVAHYWENARYVPIYLVNGGFDADKAVKNSRDLNRYFLRAYNTTVVEYQGRGHEDFYEEVLRIFDWMGRVKRDFFPKEFNCRSFRSWDNFFWWVELAELPPRAIVEPDGWPPPRNTVPVQTEATVLKTNGLNVKTGAGLTTVWLTPDLVNFEARLKITVNGRGLKNNDSYIEPDLGVLLEDVRTRGDRRHPFWAKVELPSGRINMAGR